MKITNQTIKILENYSTINNTIFIGASKEGAESTLVQIGDPKRNVAAQAIVSDIFANDVCIADLKKFLNAYNSFSDPDVSFNPDHIKIAQGSMSVEITYGDPLAAQIFKNKLVPPAGIASFTLKQADLKQILNLSNILDLPELKIYSEGGKLYLQIFKKANESSNNTVLEMGEGIIPDGQVFYLQREKLKMIEGDYQVEIIVTPSLKTSYFKSLSHDSLEYIIALAVG